MNSNFCWLFLTQFYRIIAYHDDKKYRPFVSHIINKTGTADTDSIENQRRVIIFPFCSLLIPVDS